jgi:hypothetical protein
MHWLFWAPLLAAGLHIFEEFAYPGGFVSWYRRYLPEHAARLTPMYLIGINLLLLFGCFQGAQLAFTDHGVALWLTMVSFLFFNALFHIAGAIKTRSYSPGITTAICLYLPISIYGFTRLVGTGKASAGTAMVAAIIGTTHEAYVYARNHLSKDNNHANT